MEMLANLAQVRQFIEYLDFVGLDHRALLNRPIDMRANSGARDQRISAQIIVELMDAAARAAGKKHFALEFVEWLNPHKLGVLGLIGDHCSSLQERTELESNYLYLENSAITTQLRMDEQEVAIAFNVLPNIAPDSFQFLLGLSALNLKITRQILGQNWSPLRMEIAGVHSAEEARLFRQLLRCEVRLGSDEFALIVRPEDYGRRTRPANREFLSFIVDHLRASALDWPQDLETLVAQFILLDLPGKAPSLGQIAMRLAITERSLQRKLKARGTSFGAILRQVRSDIIRKRLKASTRPSLNHLAYITGFAEPSAVCRFMRGIEVF